MNEVYGPINKVNYIDIQFKGESKNGDCLDVLSEGTLDDTYSHQIINKMTGTELIRAKTRWISHI